MRPPPRWTLGATALFALYYWFTAVQRAQLHHSRAATHIQRLLEKCPTLKGRYLPTPWCFNRHWQLVVFMLRCLVLQATSKFRRQPLLLRDGGRIALSWYPHEVPVDTPPDAPVLVLCHGITGDDDSMAGFAQQAAERGWLSVVVCRRGHGGSPLTTPKFNVLGCTGDLKEAIAAIKRERPEARLCLIGISAGSAVVVRYLGEEGGQAEVFAAAVVSPGFDTHTIWQRMEAPYGALITSRVKSFFLRANEALLCRLRGYEEGLQARRVDDFIATTLSMSGYASMEDYHVATNPMHVADSVAVPTLVISSLDDPICARESVLDARDEVIANPNSVVAILNRGSHCAFVDGLFGQGSWAERACVEYLHAALSHHRTLDSATLACLREVDATDEDEPVGLPL